MDSQRLRMSNSVRAYLAPSGSRQWSGSADNVQIASVGQLWSVPLILRPLIMGSIPVSHAEIPPSSFVPSKWLRSQGSVRMAVRRRRRVGGYPPPLPPDQSDRRGEKRNLPLGKSCRAIIGTDFWVPDPPPPLLLLPPACASAGYGGCQQSGGPCDGTTANRPPSRVAQARAPTVGTAVRMSP